LAPRKEDLVANGPELTIRSPALVVVDMQNDFVRIGAPLEVPSSRATIAAQVRMLDWFRSRDLPVVFTLVLASPKPTLISNWNTVSLPPIYCCNRGFMRSYEDSPDPKDCTAVIDEFAPRSNEYQVEKYGYNAFHRTNLTAILHSNAVDTIFVTGTVTNICVEDTARGAFHEGFKTAIISDGVSSNDSELHAGTLRNFDAKFGWVMPADEAIGRLAKWADTAERATAS
jgi:nicotinamidase-related amidase